MKYGMPYMGSKNRIAKDIIDLLPPADNFVDLFAGGCAVTHAAILSGKYKNFYLNDINGYPSVFKQIITTGKINYKICSRRMFLELKHTDPLIKYCFSFGNSGDSYLYAKDIEGVKTAATRMLLSDDRHTRSRWYSQFIRELKKFLSNNDSTRGLQGLQRLEGLQRIERLQGLQGLQRLEWLEGLQGLPGRIYVTQKDYESFEIPAGNTIVYCDPPYKDRSKYNEENFQYERFYDYLHRVNVPTFISEYSMPEDFTLLYSFSLQRRMTKQIRDEKISENLYCINYNAPRLI